jgi:hypothetical protein
VQQLGDIAAVEDILARKRRMSGYGFANGAHRRLGIGIGVVVSDPNPPGPANEFAPQREPIRSALRERSPNRAFDSEPAVATSLATAG